MRRVWMAVGVALVGVLGLALAVMGQGRAAGALVSFVPVRISQTVPAVVDVAATLDDGSTVTVTAPISVMVDLTLDLAAAMEPAADAPSTYTLEDAASLIPTLDDMPSGYYADGDVPRSLSANEDLADSFQDPESMLASLNEMGRLGGVWGEYVNSSFSFLGGENGALSATVIVFESAEGADAYLVSAIDRERERANERLSVDRLSAPRMGDNSIALRSVIDQEDPYANLAYWVRVGNTVLIAAADTLEAGGDFDEVISLMETMLGKAGR